MSTDTEWEKWGQKDPYFGVVSHEQYRSANLSAEALEEFFSTGRRDVNSVYEICGRLFGGPISPRKVLDYGSGVGRLVIPFSERAESVVGMDISESMIALARKNVKERGIVNAEFVKADDNLTELKGKFDLIHSFIVFQHIASDRQVRIVEKLLAHLNGGGIAAIQFTHAKTHWAHNYGIPAEPAPVPMVEKLTWRFKLLVKRLIGYFGGQKPVGTPAAACSQDPGMEMNIANLNQLFFIIQSCGVQRVYTEFLQHGSAMGVYLFFRKPVAGTD